MYKIGTEVETIDGQFGTVTRAQKTNVAIVYDLKLDSGRDRQYAYYDLRPKHNPFKIGEHVETVSKNNFSGMITGFAYTSDFAFAARVVNLYGDNFLIPIEGLTHKKNIPPKYRTKIKELIND